MKLTEEYVLRAILVARIIEKAEVLIEEEKVNWKSIPWHADWNEELMRVLRGEKDIAEPKAAAVVIPGDP